MKDENSKTDKSRKNATDLKQICLLQSSQLRGNIIILVIGDIETWALRWISSDEFLYFHDLISMWFDFSIPKAA